jgi:hypothetical protein
VTASESLLPVVQADRELAEFITSQTRGYGVKLPNDGDGRVQAAARFRLAATPTALPGAEEVVGNLRKLREYLSSQDEDEATEVIDAAIRALTPQVDPIIADVATQIANGETESQQ